MVRNSQAKTQVQVEMQKNKHNDEASMYLFKLISKCSLICVGAYFVTSCLDDPVNKASTLNSCRLGCRDTQQVGLSGQGPTGRHLPAHPRMRSVPRKCRPQTANSAGPAQRWVCKPLAHNIQVGLGWGGDGKDDLACHSSYLPYSQQRGWGRGHEAHPQFRDNEAAELSSELPSSLPCSHHVTIPCCNLLACTGSMH